MNESISLDLSNMVGWVSREEMERLQPEVDRVHKQMEEGQGEGHEFLGWLHTMSTLDPSELDRIQETAQQIREEADVLVCIGIGGSYLGTRAALSFCGRSIPNPEIKPQIQFAGHNISSDYICDLLDSLEGKSVYLNVISKSGTTTEPAIAFRLLKDWLVNTYGEDKARKRIMVTTDQNQGALKALANEEGYPSFVIPDNIGGRFSVLSAVGLLPIAVAGISVRELIAGALAMETVCTEYSDIDKNLAYQYGLVRHLAHEKGKSIELLAAFHPALEYVLEWWKQLFGESEGKMGRGIFPASVQYTTDLHSMGQWVQEGNRNLFETFLRVENSDRDAQIPRFDKDADGLNYLAGKTLDFINEKAYKGTAQAHLEGGVPNMTLTLRDRSAFTMGQLFYFFMRAVALSGYLGKVNPFDQPGVEFYKKNMFALLNKPGFQKE